MKKVSFNIGINRYDPEYYGRGVDLNQCVYDAQRLADYAQSRKFTATEMLDDQATASNLIAALLDLKKSLKKDDILFLSDSSHGTYDDVISGGQVKRQTAICLHDRIFWDFELRDLLKQFKTGVTIIWMADCCFAESNWRFIRGEQPSKPFNGARSRFCPTHLWKNRIGGDSRIEYEERMAKVVATQGDKRNIRAKMFAYSSSNIFQVSYEDDRGGVFTTSVLDALTKEPSLSYYQLWRRASQIIAPLYPQSPVFENVRATQLTGNRFLT